MDSVGRFVLRRQLGRGGQSTVWLAHDPRMDREVAVKVFHFESPSVRSLAGSWLQEAKDAGRLSDPNIVALHEAELDAPYPYLVFEYVNGESLAQLLQKRGALPAQEAVRLMVNVLDGLAAAHAKGLVHRDIKPANILVDTQGRARLTDFGIAARTEPGQSPPSQPLCGTLPYLSPEALAGAAPHPSMDLFACGLVLAESIIGKPLVQESDRGKALQRLGSEQLSLPPADREGLDDSLRSLVNRALALNPEQRFADAQAFAQALRNWLEPAPDDTSQAAQGASATLEFLMRRMRHKSDFPAMSSSIARILSLASSESESVSSMTSHILQDVALTNKLLRVVNSAVYQRGDSVSTVSRAVQVVGFHGIRNLALSLVLLEHMQDRTHASMLKEEFVRSLLAGALGYEFSSTAKEAEDAFLGGIFKNLGCMLTLFYFPEEAQQIRKILQLGEPPMTADQASTKVLGLSYEDLGLGVAKAWGLPEGIQKRMSRPAGTPPSRRPQDPVERLRWTSEAGNEMATLLFAQEPETARKKITEVARQYATVLGVDEAHILVGVEKARSRLKAMAEAMDLGIQRNSAAHKVLHPEAEKSPTQSSSRPGQDTESTIESLKLHATLDDSTQAPEVVERVRTATDTLTAGIQDITNAMVSDFKLADVLRMVLETMFRAIGFDRIVFCMRDAKTETIGGRLGLGEGSTDLVKKFRIPLKEPKPDLLAAVCLKGVDSMISDSSDPRIQSRLPRWYLESVNAPSFLLLPLQVKGVPLGLIYADKISAGQLELDERELGLLRTLRSQAVMAFRHST